MIPLAPIIAALAFVKPSLPPERASRLAGDIAAEADTLDEGLALVAVATVESGLRAEVETCRVTGDHGRAWSLYQLNADAWKRPYTRAQICASNRLATRLARNALRTLGGSSGHWANAMRLYVGRSATARDVRVAARVRIFRALRARSGQGRSLA